MDSKTFQVPSIGCDGCVRTIQNELSTVAGVARIDADKDTKLVSVDWNSPASWQQIEQKLTEIDYPCAKG